MRGPIATLVLALVAIMPAAAAGFETTAREAILIDDTTGAILLEKNADQLMPPSSMSKIMTVYMVFERLRDGSLAMEDELPVSETAWRMGGSKMFIDVGSRVKVADLLRGVIVQSGNDATIALAEGLAGSEDAFADQMTARAHALGMTNSTFKNASGWPHEDHLTTARDLALLASRIIRDFPDYYPLFAETEFTYNGIHQGNRNPLLYKDLGADGLKTGHTADAGYGLTASAVRDGRRLILVLNG
ncbi:MAG: D-alanyl-D-alanine carboxypeptidase family protein, partial [Alphaproteobacteria bacterium]